MREAECLACKQEGRPRDSLRRGEDNIRREGGSLRREGGSLRREGDTLRRDGANLRREGGSLRRPLSSRGLSLVREDKDTVGFVRKVGGNIN